jgi:hypothetical protein
MIRAKFKCLAVVEDKGPDGAKYQEQVSFCAVTDASEDNKSWSKWTPSGSLSMSITNHEVWGAFEVDKEYFLDFTKATEGS